MNSATAQRPLHHTVGYDSVSPFPLFRIRPRLAPCAHAESVLRGFGFSFFGMGEGEARDGFLLEGETGGIHCCVIYTLSLLVYSHSPRTFLWASGSVSLCGDVTTPKTE